MSDIGVDPVEQLMESIDNCSGDLLLCRCCSTAITQNGEKIEFGHSHHYRFTNPAGISYSIGCFRNAPGCSISELPTEENSWFGGYKWQIANCSECHEHLGWYYQGIKDRFFFGLIQDRLVAIPSN